MSVEMVGRRLDVDLLARELGNWRTVSASGPAYLGLADGLRMLIVDGRLPVGAQVPSERALADVLRVSRTTVTAAYTQMREDGYLNGRRGARSTTALPVVETAGRPAESATVNLAAATLVAPPTAVGQAFTEAAQEVTPYLYGIGIELTGVPPLRDAIAERYCRRGLPTHPDEIMVTSGALHAIGLILATYTQPGDRVLVEQPTYHGALAAMATRGIRPVPVAITREGWEVDAVDAAVRQLSPSLAYLIPDNHNPTGMTMPASDRRQLAHIIADTRTRTIIDETITDMWLDEPMPTPFAASMTSRRELVLTVGSMSKSCWGGLRIGWIRAERSTLSTIAALRPAIDMGTAILEQLAAAKLLDIADELLPERRETLRHRRALLLALLSEHRPVGRRVAAGSRDPAGAAVRGGRDVGTVHPGALHAARRAVDRGHRAAGSRVAEHHRRDRARTAHRRGLAVGSGVGDVDPPANSVDRVGGLDLTAGDTQQE